MEFNPFEFVNRSSAFVCRLTCFSLNYHNYYFFFFLAKISKWFMECKMVVEKLKLCFVNVLFVICLLVYVCTVDDVNWIYFE